RAAIDLEGRWSRMRASVPPSAQTNPQAVAAALSPRNRGRGLLSPSERTRVAPLWLPAQTRLSTGASVARASLEKDRHAEGGTLVQAIDGGNSTQGFSAHGVAAGGFAPSACWGETGERDH